MTFNQFKKLLKQALKELELEVLRDEPDITEEEVKTILDIARDKILVENNIELWGLKETKVDIKGDSFDVWERIKSYGKDVVEQELKELDTKIEEINPIKMSERISELQAKKAVVLEIKTILEK
jgi:hypothetical protein